MSQDNRATLSDIQDWVEAGSFSLGQEGRRSGFMILPHREGKFLVWYHEHCPINEPKYRRAEIQKAETAMLALASYLWAHKVHFALYFVNNQPRFTVNGVPPQVLDKKRIRYFFALYMDNVMKNTMVFNKSSLANRMEDDGK
jgi:hypothetical protein